MVEMFFLFPLSSLIGFAYSDFSSPVDSLSGSSETESDEDEKHMAELIHRMARSTLHADSKASDNNLGRFVPGSPQTTSNNNAPNTNTSDLFVGFLVLVNSDAKYPKVPTTLVVFGFSPRS